MSGSVRSITQLFRLSSTTAVLLALGSPMVAGSEPGVHSHGTAQLQVAREGQTLDILFETPAYNLVGFEHAPKNANQEQAVAKAEAWLSERPLLDTGTATCEVTAASVSHGLGSSPASARAEGHEDQHDHEDSSHNHDQNQSDGEHHDDHGAAHHETHDGHDHGHEQAHDDEAGATHSEFEVAQQLTCSGAEPVQTLISPLFGRFNALEQLHVEWVSGGGQGSVRLQSADDHFEIAP
ncbi:ZrgA family zinc uptake protein [Marinobacter salicampi]|uniref:ZrgA family zinc uptake protein n=1 Tax=Marinobacter salicampi TaxID=435907 RepID=UPI00140DE372|nr:DUF2796 domain-containing protein [Marinobacter salicampi]